MKQWGNKTMGINGHRRASGILQRVMAGLHDVQRHLPYPRTGPIQKQCAAAINTVRSLQTQLESTAAAECQADRVPYLIHSPGPNADALNEAIAGLGDDIDSE